MLTRSRSQRGEGKLEELNPKIGKKKMSQKMAGSNEREAPQTKREEKFYHMFLNMQRMIIEIYEDKKTIDATSSSKERK